jgi:hypothetical protein
MEVSALIHAPAALTPEEPPVPIGQEVGWTPEPVWALWSREESCTTGNRIWDVQPVTVKSELSRVQVRCQQPDYRALDGRMVDKSGFGRKRGRYIQQLVWRAEETHENPPAGKQVPATKHEPDTFQLRVYSVTAALTHSVFQASWILLFSAT